MLDGWRASRRWPLVTALISVATAAACAAAPQEPAGRLTAGDATASAAARPTADGMHGTVVRGAAIERPPLVLADTNGERIDLSRRPPAEVTVLVFGYTSCPDVCPATMADLATARRLMPPASRRQVQVIFVSEDPGRDTAAALRSWLDQFDPTFIGLLGGNSASRRAQQALFLPEASKAAVPRTSHATDGTPHSGYDVDHSGIVYAFARAGRTVIYTGGTGPDGYAEDFTRLVRGA